MEGMDSNFQNFFTELPVPLRVAGIVRTFKCDFHYISFLALRSHFWTLRMPYYSYMISFFMCAFPLFLQVEIHFACALFV